MRVVLIFCWVASLSAATSGCQDNNIAGRTRALGTGELLNDPLPRAAPLASFERTCGPAVRHDSRGELLDRAPYLQRVGANEATVLWTARTTAPMRLALRLPDGTVIDDVASELEPGTETRAAPQHAVTLDGLQAATTYCYALYAGGELVAGPHGFRTAPRPGEPTPFTFVAFGDSGWGGADQRAVREQLDTVAFDLLLITGDVAYPKGTLGQLESKHFDVYDPLLRSIPSYPVAGNHDYDTAGGAPFREVFALPENGMPDGRERWFSFDYGNAHFVALDTQRMGEAQARWLEADLTDNTLPWTIVYAHHPPYSSGHHGSVSAFRTWFGESIEKHQVSLVLGGHDHHYERTHAQNGVTYVVTGGGGRGVRTAGSSSFTAYAEAVLHFVAVQITDDWLRLHAIDATGREFDALEIGRAR